MTETRRKVHRFFSIMRKGHFQKSGITPQTPGIIIGREIGDQNILKALGQVKPGDIVISMGEKRGNVSHGKHS
jgi:hypothetical protein